MMAFRTDEQRNTLMERCSECGVGPGQTHMSNCPYVLSESSLDETETLETFIYKVMMDQSILLEKRIILLIRPKPRWISQNLWNKLASKFLMIQEK